MKVLNRRNGLVSGVTFEVAFDGQHAYSVNQSLGMYTVVNVPEQVKTVTVRAFDDNHDKTAIFSANDTSYDFHFEKAPVSGLDLWSFVAAYLRLRQRFINRIAFVLVTGGIAMASSPWWVPLLYSLLGLAEPDFQPPSDILSWSLIAVGVLLAIWFNWDNKK